VGIGLDANGILLIILGVLGWLSIGCFVVRLTTDCPTCQRQVAFTRQYGKCRVFYCMLGHGSQTWNNPAFTDLLDQGIRWATGR